MIDTKALKKLIESGGVSYKQNASSFIFTCPRCEKREKLWLRKRDGRFVCWVCKETENFQGKPEYALTEILGLSIPELRGILYGTEFIPLVETLEVEFSDSDFWDEPEAELQEVAQDPNFVGPESPAFEKGALYCLKRGISFQRMLDYDIKYDPYTERVVFPVKASGKLLGWQGRYIGSNTKIPKIKTSHGLKGDRCLMFQDRLMSSEHTVLAEGPVSAIKAHLCGGNVASMGKAVSKAQLSIIRRQTSRLYVALDPDAADDIMRVCTELYDEMELYFLPPPPGSEDLGDATEEAVFEEFKNAKPANGKLFISFGSSIAF